MKQTTPRSGLSEEQLAAIRREVQVQMREQFAAQIKFLEQRVANLEAQQEPPSIFPNFSSSFKSRNCCDLAPSHSDGRNARNSHAYAALSRTRLDPLDLEPAGGQEDPAGQLPESMYNYCMQRIAASPTPWRDPALRWWIVLFACQAITMNSFCVVNDLETNFIAAQPPGMRDHGLSTCLFSNAKISGVPYMQYCIGYVAIILVAGVIRSDDKETLAATFPHLQHDIVMQWLVSFAWFWQTIYMPGTFALESATMFARSPDALAVVMNTLAVTFVMDIDNMLYSNLLSDKEKEVYQQRTGVYDDDTLAKPTIRKCTWVLFTFNVSVMVLVFTHILASFGSAILSGDAALGAYWWSIPPFYLASFGGRFLLQRIYGDPVEKGGLSRCLSTLPATLGAGALGAGIYFLGVNSSALRFLVPPFVYFTADEFLACQ